MKPEDVDWDEAKKVVEKEKPRWYEQYDEVEGIFMGWRKMKSHKCVTFKEFSEWWEPYVNKSL